MAIWTRSANLRPSILPAPFFKGALLCGGYFAQHMRTQLGMPAEIEASKAWLRSQGLIGPF
jgi:hypothetical protein